MGEGNGTNLRLKTLPKQIISWQRQKQKYKKGKVRRNYVHDCRPDCFNIKQHDFSDKSSRMDGVYDGHMSEKPPLKQAQKPDAEK